MDWKTLISISPEELRAQARIPFSLLPTIPEVLEHFAQAVADTIRERNAAGEPARLILPVGPTGYVTRLVEICNADRISWRNTHVFQMDEWLDWQGRLIADDDPLSFRRFFRERLFNQLDAELRIPFEQVHSPHPFRVDEISAAIERVGGIDVCFGGIGYHGHVAFNEPVISRWYSVSEEEFRASKTRVVFLAPDSIQNQSIGCAGGCYEAIPPMAVTLGMKDILASRKIRLYCAGGARHSHTFRRAVAGDVSVAHPATLVQGHPDAMVVTSEEIGAAVAVGL